MYDSHTHSFITKIWLEENVGRAQGAAWRGMITHVPSGARRHLQNLGDILAFIVPYLEEMDVRLNLYWRVRRWLQRIIGRSRQER